MIYVEQILYGYNHLTETSGREELAHSAGIGAEVATEIHGLCEAWGQAPDLGLQQPVLLSHPLNSTMPALRGRLYTVICVVNGEVPLFNSMVLTDAAYSAYGRNPYALARAVKFCHEWDGRPNMDRIELDPEISHDLVVPAANPADVGLVDQAVLQFISTGTLELPLEQAVRDSDRAMALIIACLPEKNRKELKFASFTTAKANPYNVSSLETPGATFASWQRLMMARIDTGITQQQQAYVQHIADYLCLGDLAGISRVSGRHNFSAPGGQQSVVATRQGVESTDPAATPTPRRTASPPKTISRVATVGSGGPGVAPSRRPMLAATGTSQRQGALPEHGLDPAADRSKSGAGARAAWQRDRVGSPVAKGKRGAAGRFLRIASVSLLLFAAGWVGTMWLEGRTLSESLEWAGLPGMDGRTNEVKPAGSLLAVIDVSQVYDRALKHAGGSGFALNASRDRRREKALGELQSQATEPLLEQVALFVKLSTEGIQQSGRPDREVERLDSLAQQGQVLEKELARLELAWYSLTTSTNWTDLGKLSDAAVVARRDSLDRVEKDALADLRFGMGTDKTWKELSVARRHADGMADLVRLFQAKKWSPNWEKNLARAAEKVSPTAGKTTRAYRNSAFALLRLKRAERDVANRELPFAASCSADLWPTENIGATLPRLRKEAGRFKNQDAPPLLAATLALYSALEAPARTADKILESPRQWQRLQKNAAARFDAELYGDFLGRLRYEAAVNSLAKMPDPAEIPEHLYRGDARDSVAAFADSLVAFRALAPQTQAARWRAVATAAGDPFLGRWAQHEANKMQLQLAAIQHEFDIAWNECRSQAVALREQAAAGQDWTTAWQQLHEQANAVSRDFRSGLSDDPDRHPKMAYMRELVIALEAQRPLHLTRVTVRLKAEMQTEPTAVQVELRTPEQGSVWTSEPFTIGPAAPAGTGWVGTAFLAWQVPLAADHHLLARVVAAADQRELLTVSYASLDQGAGPAALERPQAGAQGSLSFGVNLADYWPQLQIPDPEAVF